MTKLKMFLALILIVVNCYVLNAQSSINLENLKFEKIGNSKGVTESIKFYSNTKGIYTITTKSLYTSKTYIDKCPCECEVKDNVISIMCECDDKEIYDTPIEDAFLFDALKNQLKSTKWRETNGNPIYWKLKI